MADRPTDGTRFDGATFLAAKIDECADRIGSLRAEENSVRAELDKLTQRLEELAASIAHFEQEQFSYQLTLDQLTGAHPAHAGQEAHNSRAAELPTAARARPRTRKASAATGAGERTKRQARARSAPVADSVMRLFTESPTQEWSVKEIHDRLPQVSQKVLSNTVLRLHKRARLDRTRAGYYRITVNAS
jgi:chromosome segregation ATPase